MNRVLRVAAILFIAVLGAPSGNWADENRKDIKGWGTVVDPAGDCKVAEKDGKLTITVPGTHHDLNPTSPYENVLAPRVLQPVEGDFTAQVSVDVYRSPGDTANSKAGVTYVGAGLVLWQDEKNFMRFVRAARGERIVHSHLELFRDGRTVGDGGGALTADKPTLLKLTRKGNSFSFAVSEDGKDWTELQTSGVNPANINLPTKLQVGVVAINATTKEFAPQLEGLTVKADQ